MTNYMELIMSNQPWNLIFFMGIPVIPAESLVVTEFYILWHSLPDKIAVMSYLIGVVPLLGITFLESGLVGKNLNKKSRRQVHFLLLTGFLVVSHIAMIFGMTEPTLEEMPMQHEHEHMHHH